MNGNHLRMLNGALISALIGGSLGLPVSAHCQQNSPGEHVTTDISSITPPSGLSQREFRLLEARVKKLDQQITQSLEKITELEIFQSNDQSNPHKNDELIAEERMTLNDTEDELSEKLQEEEEARRTNQAQVQSSTETAKQ